MTRIISSEATKPPTLTMPVAEPSRPARVRATSKPTIDPDRRAPW